MTARVPAPKLLQDHAAALRAEATAQRRLVNERLAQRSQLDVESERASRRRFSAEQELKTAGNTLATEREAAKGMRDIADEALSDAVAAERAGKTAQAEEFRESAERFRASATAAEANAAAAQRDVDELTVRVAELTRQSKDLFQQVADANRQSNTAERLIDQMENQARLVDEASRRAQFAETLDNPVERADAELEAERLFAQAKAIDVDTAAIAAASGRDVTVPDVDTLPVAPDEPVAAADTSDAASFVDGAVGDEVMADTGDTGFADAGFDDAGLADSGPDGSGLDDSGLADSGLADAGTTDVGATPGSVDSELSLELPESEATDTTADVAFDIPEIPEPSTDFEFAGTGLDSTASLDDSAATDQGDASIAGA